ncbi:hypothetical protein INT48_004261 [Thamnidium elegans]|uniref:DDHD domain-containing protein n=1 Tax=Thamnidium elegans TaxID=101142 RepID=A0A8H7SVP7_9FUNG|nr:hypothetical protein INT48_004261 [Thamnidium elegans]
MIPNNHSNCSDHLVFFIHGMGQQYEKYGNLQHHVSTIQKNTTNLLSSRYPEKNLRVKYIPIEWHSEVQKRVGTDILKSTLATVPNVRLTINDWLLDNFSKPHGQYIIDSVCKQCDVAYQNHKLEYPEFDGHVHFIGFSLGGIIAYDVASMQWFNQDGLPPWKNKLTSEQTCQMPDISVPQLQFKIRYVFTCGSPIDYIQYRPPLRTRVYNIFHPFDPLGYRLEPMINSDYILEPVQIHRLKRLPKIPNLGIRSSIAGAKPLLQSIWQYVSSSVTSNIQEVRMGTKRKEGDNDDITPIHKRRKLTHDVSVTLGGIQGKDGLSYPRTDYVLSENMIDAYASEWIIALKSHFRYWANRDLALHMIKVFLSDENVALH